MPERRPFAKAIRDQGSGGIFCQRYDQSVWRIPSVYLDDHINPFAKEGERADISESQQGNDVTSNTGMGRDR
jgi:hypothetical protein